MSGVIVDDFENDLYSECLEWVDEYCQDRWFAQYNTTIISTKKKRFSRSTPTSDLLYEYVGKRERPVLVNL